MIVFKNITDKPFQTKEELFKFYKENKEDCLRIKKANQAKFKTYNQNIHFRDNATKGEERKNITIGDYVHSVVNTSYYFDSHQDVHIPKNWNKTIKDKNKAIYHVTDHELKTTHIVSKPSDVEFSVKDVAWKQLGINFEGNTEVLTAKSKITSITPKDYINLVNEGVPLQSSPRMRYISYKVAINAPDDEDLKEETAEYNKHIDKIANKEEVEKDGFFFAVYESSLESEFSSVVFGSNKATPLTTEEITETKEQPSNDIVKDSEPSNDTPQIFINTI